MYLRFKNDILKKSFKKIIDETFDNKSNWNYYTSKARGFHYNPMDSIESSRKFLKDFIILSGKAEGILYNEIDKLKDRATHVVSAFFTGHYIYENTHFKTSIDHEIKKLVEKFNVKSDVGFSFVWFLTCLFHDLGYKIEDSKPKTFKSFKDLETSLSQKLPENNGIPKFYNLIYKNYFTFRIKQHDKNDHGIVAAHLLYDSLCTIREFTERNPSESYKNLCWEKQLLDVYNFCAWNILGHNMWFGSKCKPEDVNQYSKFKIKRLLLKCNQIKLKLKDHPFFFFFCLVDTIEPYKKVLDYDSLDKVFLEIEDYKIKISTDLKCSCGQEIIKQATSLNNWLIPANKKPNGSVIINLKMQLCPKK